MENNPKPLQIEKFQDVKTYSLVWFRISDRISTSQVYLVDKKNRKIWMYQMNCKASDETKRSIRMYETDKDKDWTKQRIGIELFKLMDNHDGLIHHLKIIAHSDSAKEIEKAIYDVRILQTELYLRILHNHCTWETEEAVAEHFGTI